MLGLWPAKKSGAARLDYLTVPAGTGSSFKFQRAVDGTRPENGHPAKSEYAAMRGNENQTQSEAG